MLGVMLVRSSIWWLLVVVFCVIWFCIKFYVVLVGCCLGGIYVKGLC